MKKDLTEIAYILDRSGSMQSLVEPAIAGFNRFLKDQQEAPGQARFTLVLFDDQYEVPCDGLPIGEVVELDTTTFVPRGSTSLLDAIGRTITDLGAKLAALPESDRPGQVIVAIFTDGEENSSTEFDLKQISAMIKHQQDAYKWTFLFLGANQDAIATAARMGIGRSYSASFALNEKGLHSSSSSISRKMKSMRAYQDTGVKDADYDAPMEQLLREEEDKSDPEP